MKNFALTVEERNPSEFGLNYYFQNPQSILKLKQFTQIS